MSNFQNNSEEINKEMLKAFLNIQVIGKMGISIFNTKRLAKEMRGHLETFTKAPADELQKFAGDFVDTCLGSKSYGTTFFGTVHMSDGGQASRLAEDIIDVTENIPARFGLKEEYLPVKKALICAYLEKVKDGARFLEEQGIDL